jgi:hypothetical protein
VNFVKVRMTHFPVDAIDQIDEIGGRVRVSLSNGIKIDLDPIEGEKVLKQVSAFGSLPATVPQQDHSTVIALMARVAALEARVASLSDRAPKARAKANA